MFEKVNPSHPDKLCDRIAGAIVDLAYAQVKDPRIAVEVLLGHGICHIIVETDISLPLYEIEAAVERIAGKVAVDYVEVAQDRHLARNQEHGFRCGDNGIFKGVPVTEEQRELTWIAREIYEKYGCDGKYILDVDRLILCQSNAATEELQAAYPKARRSTLWVIGPVVRMWILVPPTGSWAVTWQIVSQVAACMGRTCPRPMCPSTSGHGSRHRKPASP